MSPSRRQCECDDCGAGVLTRKKPNCRRDACTTKIRALWCGRLARVEPGTDVGAGLPRPHSLVELACHRLLSRSTIRKTVLTLNSM